MSCPPRTTRDGFTVAGARLLNESLTRRLVPVVDRIRDLHTRFGGRPYRVVVVRTRSAGAHRGRGPEVLISELEILPTPLVVDLSSLSEVLTPVGINEQGLIRVEQISGRYTEDLLLGTDPQGDAPPPNEATYWEIEFFRPDGQPAVRRRFQLSAAPMYQAYRFGWSVTLTSSVENRARSGGLRG